LAAPVTQILVRCLFDLKDLTVFRAGKACALEDLRLTAARRSCYAKGDPAGDDRRNYAEKLGKH
jgi:hypothetical protein